MPAQQRLRVAGADEKPTPKSITEAAARGTKRELLVAMRDRIAKTVEDPKCPPRDLASLSRRLMELAKEIEATESDEEAAAGVDQDGEAADAAFDSKAL